MRDAPDRHAGPGPTTDAIPDRHSGPGPATDPDPDGYPFPGGHPLPDSYGADPPPSDPPDPSFDPARPFPPLTWRERLDDLVARLPSSGRLVAAVVAVVVVILVGWRLLAPPAPPPEMAIPFADASVPEAGEAGAGAAGSDGAGGAGAPAPAASSGSAAPGAAAMGAEAGGEIVVHVVGAVAAPGVQHLPAGSRVADAVEAAGGASPDADLSRINLAAVATDGQQVYVLRQGEQQPPPPAGGTGDPAGGEGPVNVNTATASQLEELPGVGPATAEAIIAHRDQHGPFGSVDDLIDVRGIGEAKLEQIRERATV